MATGDEVMFTHYEYQADSGAFLEPGLPPEFARSLEDLSAGKLRLAGRAIVDTETHRFVGSISLAGGSSIELGTDGTILLNNAVQASRLREVMGTSAIPRAIVTGDLSSFGGAFPADINRTITLAPQGAVIYVNDSVASGKGRYTRVDSAVYGEAGPPMTNSLGRLATSRDLLTRGVAGWLSRNAPQAVDRLKLQGVTLPDGKTSTNGSDIVRAIAANISVTPIITYLLRSGE